MKAWTVEAEVSHGECQDTLDDLILRGADLRVWCSPQEVAFQATLSVPGEAIYWVTGSSRKEAENNAVLRRQEALRYAMKVNRKGIKPCQRGSK